MMAPGMMIGFLAGLGAGAILGILFAPKKGKEMRSDIKNKAMTAREKMQQQVAKQKERAKETASKAAKTPQRATGKPQKETSEASGESTPR